MVKKKQVWSVRPILLAGTCYFLPLFFDPPILLEPFSKVKKMVKKTGLKCAPYTTCMNKNADSEPHLAHKMHIYSDISLWSTYLTKYDLWPGNCSIGRIVDLSINKDALPRNITSLIQVEFSGDAPRHAATTMDWGLTVKLDRSLCRKKKTIRSWWDKCLSCHSVNSNERLLDENIVHVLATLNLTWCGVMCSLCAILKKHVLHRESLLETSLLMINTHPYCCFFV